MTQIKSKGVTKAYATLFIGLCARTCIYTLYMCNWFFLCLFIFLYVIIPFKCIRVCNSLLLLHS